MANRSRIRTKISRNARVRITLKDDGSKRVTIRRLPRTAKIRLRT